MRWQMRGLQRGRRIRRRVERGRRCGRTEPGGCGRRHRRRRLTRSQSGSEHEDVARWSLSSGGYGRSGRTVDDRIGAAAHCVTSRRLLLLLVLVVVLLMVMLMLRGSSSFRRCRFTGRGTKHKYN